MICRLYHSLVIFLSAKLRPESKMDKSLTNIKLAVGLVMMLVAVQSTHALPQIQDPPDVTAAPTPTATSPWVQVYSNGSAHTVTPYLGSTDGFGATTTISPAPLALIYPGVWTMSSDSQTITSTGTAPVAVATGSGQEGAFLVCEADETTDAPMCQPDDGTMLTPGFVYYVTWDATHYDTNNTVQVQGDYGNGDGFSSDVLPASQGFYSWPIATDFLQTQGDETVQVSLYIGLVEEGLGDIGVENRGQGPTVYITNPSPSASSDTNPLAIVLPILISVIALGAAVALILFRRRQMRKTGSTFFGGLFKRPTWLGTTKSRRVRTAAGVKDSQNKSTSTISIQLSSSDGWSTNSITGGQRQDRNVFRDEIVRQQRERARR
ncbi:hypothetical protein BX600DRAFT_539681 [Xylariales sp. PMI_506]|nr:hypothetical protein BX600DRAFT_539681 [Xylariales sp. PMI_506]